MVEQEDFVVLEDEYCILIFEIVVLDVFFECRISKNVQLKKVLHSLKHFMNKKDYQYNNFENALVFDPISKTFICVEIFLSEYHFPNGYKLLII